MAAQHDLFRFAEVDEDGVEAASGRMPFRNVQRFEVVPSGLDLGAFGNGEAHTDKYVFEAITGLGDEVGVTTLDFGHDLGEVEPFRCQLLCLRGGRQCCATLIGDSRYFGHCLIKRLARRLAVVGGKVAEGLL